MTSSFKSRSIFCCWLLLLATFPTSISSYKLCAPEDGGGVCPDHNTCCPTSTPGVSACISVKEGDTGACCNDDGLGLTGCADGYQCIIGKDTDTDTSMHQFLRNQNHKQQKKKQQQPEHYCKRIDPDYNGTKPKPMYLPRYRLCKLPPQVLEHVYGLPMIDAAQPDKDRVNAAYFSTMGSLDTNDHDQLSRHQHVKTVLIMVHGSGRTAEDYLCGAVSSLPVEQQDPNNATIMVLAPWFLDPDDNEYDIYHTTNADGSMTFHYDLPVKLPNNTLRWMEEGDVLYHTWRYGADAINSSISSFAVMDRMVERLAVDPVRFPSLERILVAGHSAGGQFVQRWALLSNIPVWGSSPGDGALGLRQRAVQIRAIPANPRCFAYLDDKRFVSDEQTKEIVFQRPSDSTIAQCPDYNEWIWGLDEGGNITAPYKDRAIAMAGGAERVTRRYVSERRLIYLAGEEDEEIFEDDCGSVIQGQTRRERSRGFMASLHKLYPQEMETGLHERLLVKGVPHDHSLMFQSPEGQRALFGDDSVDVDGFQSKVDGLVVETAEG